jgi:hypothetical protein
MFWMILNIQPGAMSILHPLHGYLKLWDNFILEAKISGAPVENQLSVI